MPISESETKTSPAFVADNSSALYQDTRQAEHLIAGITGQLDRLHTFDLMSGTPTANERFATAMEVVKQLIIELDSLLALAYKRSNS
jgi:hypothetical protein